MSNALDHTQDPHTVFENLWRAVKPGGWLIIQSHEREATHEGRIGFHQHDVWLQGQALVIDGSSVMDADETVLREDGRRRFVWMKHKPDAS
jgi:SAM-dependent methyltransferase